MFPNWKRDDAKAAEPKVATKPDAGGCCGGKAKTESAKPAAVETPPAGKKKGGCCG